MSDPMMPQWVDLAAAAIFAVVACVALIQLDRAGRRIRQLERQLGLRETARLRRER